MIMATENDISSIPEFTFQNPEQEGSSMMMSRFKLESQISATAKSKNQNGLNLSVTPIIVDFNRLMQQQKLSKNRASSVVSGISNNDLLHAVVGLYDTCLTELTPDVIYSTVCDKWARTIILVRDVKDVFLEFEKRRDKRHLSKEHHTFDQINIGDLKADGPQDGGDKYHAPEPVASTFACCYSESESEESDDDSDDDDDDYSKGINSYLGQVTERRKARLRHSGPFTVNHVGPENRIIAACTFDKKYIKTGEKIAHLSLISIRKRFRSLGLGKYLVKQVKDPIIAGTHDAVVVHAESEAAPFFARYGFSDDVLLNSRWKEISEQFTNCILLTYLPPYTGQAVADTVSDFDLLSLDKDLRQWKDKSLEAYQSQVTVIERMKAEMIRLRAMVSSQSIIIKDLKSKVGILETNKLKADNQLMMHKIDLLTRQTAQGEAAAANDLSFASSDTLLSRYQILSNLQIDEDCDTDNRISPPRAAPALTSSTEQELKRYMVVPKHAAEVYDHGKDIAEFHRICEDFKSGMKKDLKSNCRYTVTSVCKALLSQSVVDRYARLLKDIGHTSLMMKLYFCGSLEHPERLKDILKNGFSDQDVVDGTYGRGLYFSRAASTAVRFTTPHKVLVAEVIIGKFQTLAAKDKGRTSTDKGYNSILCPGRLAATGEDATAVQEYVIFDCNQALPLDLIEFTVTQAATT